MCDKFVELLVLFFKVIVFVLYLIDGGVFEESFDIMCWVFEVCDFDGWWCCV